VDRDEDKILRFRFIIPREPDSIGLWCYEDINGDRHDISDLDVGSRIDAVRSLGTTSLVLGFYVWLSYMIAVCVRFDPKAFKLIG
jgi:hypothetical protein